MSRHFSEVALLIYRDVSADTKEGFSEGVIQLRWALPRRRIPVKDFTALLI
jgi:hypothetical protein